MEEKIREIIITMTPTVFLSGKIARYEYIKILEDCAKLLPRNANVLDIGCGCGYSTAYLCYLRKDISITGADPWSHPKAWNKLSKLVGSKRCNFLKADGQKLSFRSEEFDAVISFGVMEHISDDNGFLRELNRVLRKGGQNIIYHLPNRYSFNELLARILGKNVHAVRYSMSDTKKILEKNGFRIVKIEREYFLPLQLYKINKRFGDFFNNHYKAFFSFDSFLMKTPLNRMCQSFKIVSVKENCQIFSRFGYIYNALKDCWVFRLDK
ncbi:MAG: methyltransferase domain-containing protein [Candidatus Aenigmatarchaeota archaeon]